MIVDNLCTLLKNKRPIDAQHDSLSSLFKVQLLGLSIGQSIDGSALQAVKDSSTQRKMFRPTASRAILRTLTPAQSSRLKYSAALGINKNVTLFRALAHRRPQAIQSLIRPTTTTLFYATKSEPKKSDATGVMKKKLEHHPETVSGHSSVRHIMSEEGGGNKSQHEEDMMAGIKQDIVTIKDTFALTTVPKESYYIGAAGILPYAATALSTAYLAFDVNHAAQHGMGYLFSPELASQLLEIITPLQIGYGAVVSSAVPF